MDNNRPPYNHLYIYLIEGQVKKEAEPMLGEDFIGNWVEDGSSFLFFSKPADAQVDSLLSSEPRLRLADSYQFTYEQWQGGAVEPMRIGIFLITPPWLPASETEGSITIRLDPGVVFGNCLHPTTRDCLKAISFAAAQRPFERVVDLGTGTGVLAVASAFLGARHVFALDINPLSVKTARRNVSLNGLEDVIEVKEGRAEDFNDVAGDLLVANIHFPVIKELVRTGGLAKRERIILSGLLRSQWRDIRDMIEKKGFRVIREWDHNFTWFTGLAQRR